MRKFFLFKDLVRITAAQAAYPGALTMLACYISECSGKLSVRSCWQWNKWFSSAAIRNLRQAISYITKILDAVGRLLKPYGVRDFHRPAGNLRSPLTRIKDLIGPNKQPSIIYSAQCKHWIYTRQADHCWLSSKPTKFYLMMVQA